MLPQDAVLEHVRVVQTYHKRSQCLRHILSFPARLYGNLLYNILDDALSLLAGHFCSEYGCYGYGQ